MSSDTPAAGRRPLTIAFMDLDNIEHFLHRGVRINYPAFRRFLAEKYGVDRVEVYDSYTDEDDPRLNRFEKMNYMGYKVNLYPAGRNDANQNGKGQKEVDTSLVADIVYYACKGIADTIVLLSGDRDMAPGLRIAYDCGCRIVLLPFSPEGCSRDLVKLADTVDFIESSGPDGILEFIHPTNMTMQNDDDQTEAAR